jgi:heat shock protein HslJ
LLLAASLPVRDAFADSTRRTGRTHVKANRTVLIAPAAALSLAGQYALTSVGRRPVRDEELAKSKIIFSPNGDVSVMTACNTLGARLQTRSKPGQILGFSNPAQTLLPCQGRILQAETTTTHLVVDTANIARAGNIVTFFDANGVNIAQWTAVSRPVSPREASAPQPGAPAPTRVYFGDYVLAELGGRPVASYPARPAPTPRGMPAAPEASPPNFASNVRLAPSVPTLFLREDGSVMGSSGCNPYNSRLNDGTGGNKRFGRVVSTKKACLDQNLGRLEADFFLALRAARRVEVTDRYIDLFAANGNKTARLGSISAGAPGGPSLFGTTWILRSLNNEPISRNNAPTITFSGEQASGSTGCNQFTIQHTRQNGRSQFRRSIMTERACASAGPNNTESRFMRALEASTIIDVSSTTLILRSVDNRTILTFDTN